MSELELMVLEDIMAWCEKNNINYYNSPEQATKQFWSEKLC